MRRSGRVANLSGFIRRRGFNLKIPRIRAPDEMKTCILSGCRAGRIVNLAGAIAGFGELLFPLVAQLKRPFPAIVRKEP